jgi:ankyrin repeat protein
MEKYITITENGSITMDLSLKNENGNTMLHELCAKPIENFEFIKKLINYVPSDLLNKRNNEGNTVLHILCIDYYVSKNDKLYDLVKLLLNKGVDCNIKNENNNTPLYLLLDSVFDKTACLLLEKVTNINEVYYHDNTLLHRICSHYKNFDEECHIFLKKLISLGCNANAQNSKKVTPLMVSFENSNENKCIDLLLKNKADITLCNKAGFDGYYYAEKYGYKKYIKKRTVEIELQELKEKYDNLEKKFEQIKLMLQ